VTKKQTNRKQHRRGQIHRGERYGIGGYVGLAAAVIGQAADDATYRGRNRRMSRISREARGWLAGHTCAEWCDLIGLDAGAVRQAAARL